MTAMEVQSLRGDEAGKKRMQGGGGTKWKMKQKLFITQLSPLMLPLLPLKPVESQFSHCLL